MEKPLLMLCKVLKTPCPNSVYIGVEPTYTLLPLAEVELSGLWHPVSILFAIRKAQAEAEWLALSDKETSDGLHES